MSKKHLFGLLALAILSTVLLAVTCGGENLSLDNTESNAEIEPPKDSIFYGFNFNHFNVHRDTVRNGDSFGEILLNHRIGYPQIAEVTSRENRDIFDLRRIRVGRPYIVLNAKDSIGAAQVFIYEIDQANFVCVDLRDGIKLEAQQRKIKSVEREVSGIIKTSLSEAILEQNIDYDVTYGLSSIYAWTIDFWKLQKGDKFKVVYQEHFVNDTTYVGMGPIDAAYFEHNGKSFYAFRHQDKEKNITEYFDEKGKNLRRAFLMAPVDLSYARVSSRFNLKRKISYYGRVKPHKGTDYAAKIGSPIVATANGRVVAASYTRANGKYVKIRHNGTYTTQYLHMKNRKVKKGDYVKQGDVIGWVGMTGNTSGPHVCYRFWKNGRQVDPYKQKLPAADPLPKKVINDFLTTITPLKSQLDCITFFDNTVAQIN